MDRNIVLVGTTAAGKSQLAIDFVKYCVAKDSRGSLADFEIISLDSMQVYEGMEIGTGVVEPKDREGISHHMISFVDPKNDYNVKEFQNDVYSILNSNRSKRFILVGGTGLYTHAVVDGFSFAPSDSGTRQKIIEQHGLDENNPDETNVKAAYEKLAKLDSQAAKKIDPNNVRRIVRALEAIEISGEQFSDIGDGLQAFGKPVIEVDMVGLRYSREVLRDRISQRVDEMFENGWVDEVKRLMAMWDEIVAPARNAIGYSQIRDWVNNGEHYTELKDLKEVIINKTAQFSRRQRKWFERDPRITWIDCDTLESDEIITRIYKFQRS